MTKIEYAEFELAVANFMAQEGIKYLCSGYLVCPICKIDFDGDICPNCGGSRECFDESFFSWEPCECCGTTLGGNRQHAPALSGGKILEYTICSDCAYYAEYGELPRS